MIDESMFNDFDPDSSPYVWDNVYVKLYRGIKWINNDILSAQLEIKSGTKKRGVKKINRILFGGETDFNFNEAKCFKEGRGYHSFKRIVMKDGNLDDKEKMELIKKLEIYNEDKHHSNENFSIMPVVGGLQIIKRQKCDDQLHCFLKLLLLFWKGNRDVVDAIKSSDLVDYLNSFGKENDEPIEKLYCYCSEIYRITDKEWINKMLALAGGMDNDTLEKVTNTIKLRKYITYANEFWEKKKQILQEIDLKQVL